MFYVTRGYEAEGIYMMQKWRFLLELGSLKSSEIGHCETVKPMLLRVTRLPGTSMNIHEHPWSWTCVPCTKAYVALKLGFVWTSAAESSGLSWFIAVFWCIFIVEMAIIGVLVLMGVFWCIVEMAIFETDPSSGA